MTARTVASVVRRNRLKKLFVSMKSARRAIERVRAERRARERERRRRREFAA